MLKLISSAFLFAISTNLFAGDLECELRSTSTVEGHVYFSIDSANQVEAVEIELDGEYTKLFVISNELFELSLQDDLGLLSLTFDLATKSGKFTTSEDLFDHSDNYVGSRDSVMEVVCK